jgi:hypothetical protein
MVDVSVGPNAADRLGRCDGGRPATGPRSDEATKRRRRTPRRFVALTTFACCFATFAVGLLLTAGCVPPLKIHPPDEARRVLENIDDNLAGIQRALYGRPALVSFRFRDEQGRTHRFVAQPATVIFRPPRCLYFDIKESLGGSSVARLGSNDERYWLWVDAADTQRLWWGTWAALLSGHARPLVVPPDRLLDALMMRPLPARRRDGPPPLLVEADGKRRLWFQEFDDPGWPHVAREIILARNPTDLPAEIIDRLIDGRIAMHARLYDYRPVGDGADAPLTPRRYVVDWPTAEAGLRLDLLDVRYRTKDTPFCDFPRRWRGEVEPLDLPAEPGEQTHAAAAAGHTVN